MPYRITQRPIPFKEIAPMAGLWRLAFCVIALGLMTATGVQAGGRVVVWSAPPIVTYYYYAVPTPVWVMPYYSCAPVIVVPRVIPVPDARPTAAPPSSTGEPPLLKKTSNDPRAPVIVTSHAIGSNFVPGKAPLAKGFCRVGFWNLSGREVTLVIDGKVRTLAKDRSVTLDLDREFSWQIEGRLQHVERVAEGQATLELVIRE
jgi:hypothetical protein